MKRTKMMIQSRLSSLKLVTLALMLLLVLPSYGQRKKKKNSTTVTTTIITKTGLDENVYNAAKWRLVGPFRGGRASAVTGVPGKPNLYYMAATGGGVWRTKDGGQTWEKILYVNADAGAVDLLLDPNNPRIMYASTWRVRRTPFSLDSGGEGSALWKSTDGGDTWTDISANKGLPGGVWGISGVAVSPVNSNRVWALIENDKGGVYRSDDGGENWRKINDSRALRQRAWYYTRIYADTQDENICYVMNVRYHKSTDGGLSFKAYNAPHGDHHDLWIAPEDNQRMIIADDGGAQVSKSDYQHVVHVK